MRKLIVALLFLLAPIAANAQAVGNGGSTGVCNFGTLNNTGLYGFPLCDSSGNLKVNVQALTGPYSATSGQTAATNSFFGQSIFNGSTVDPWRGGPAGTAVSNGTAGIPYVQGIGASGSMPITGTGTTASPATGIVTVQGNASGVAVPVSGTVVGSGTFNMQGVVGGTDLPISIDQTTPGTTNGIIQNGLDGTGSLTALNSTVQIALHGGSGITFTVSGTWVGTISFTASANNGSTFPANVFCGSQAHGNGNAFTANDTYFCSPSGYGVMQLQMTAYTSGTANIAYHVSPIPVGIQITGASGALATVNYPADSQTYQGIGTIAQLEGYNLQTNNYERIKTSASNSDGLSHTQGIQSTVQNSTGAQAPIACDNSYPIDNITTAGTTTVQALSAGKNIYVCGISLSLGTSTTAKLQKSTSATCASGTTDITGAYAVSTSYGTGIGTIIAPITAGDSLCLVVVGTGGVNGIITYSQF